MSSKSQATSGTRYGSWTLVSDAPTERQTTQWVVRCDCGTVRTKPLSKITTGQSRSCGCRRAAAHQKVLAHLSGGA